VLFAFFAVESRDREDGGRHEKAKTMAEREADGDRTIERRLRKQRTSNEGRKGKEKKREKGSRFFCIFRSLGASKPPKSKQSKYKQAKQRQQATMRSRTRDESR